MVEANVRALNVWTGLSGLRALLLRGVSRNSTRSRKSCGLHVGMQEHAAKDADGFSAKDADDFSAQDADDFSAQDADGFSVDAGVLPGAPAAHGRQSALHSGPTAETKVKQRTYQVDKGAGRAARTTQDAQKGAHRTRCSGGRGKAQI